MTCAPPSRVLSLLLFLALMVWVWCRGAAPAFDEAARLPSTASGEAGATDE